MRTVSIFGLLIPLLLSCSESKKLNEIEVEITENNQYFINGKLIAKSNLNEVLSNERMKILKTGIRESDIVVTLTISKNSKIGAVSNVQTILRKLNLRKLRYTDNEGQET